MLDRGRSDSPTESSRALVVRRLFADATLSPLNVRARRSRCWETEGSLRTSPFLSDAKKASSPDNITCSVSKSRVLPSAGNSHSCKGFGRPLDPRRPTCLVYANAMTLERSWVGTYVVCILQIVFSNTCSAAHKIQERLRPTALRPPSRRCRWLGTARYPRAL